MSTATLLATVRDEPPALEVVSKGCSPLYMSRKCERCSEQMVAVLMRGDDGWELAEFNSKCEHWPE